MRMPTMKEVIQTKKNISLTQDELDECYQCVLNTMSNDGNVAGHDKYRAFLESLLKKLEAAGASEEPVGMYSKPD